MAKAPSGTAYIQSLLAGSPGPAARTVATAVAVGAEATERARDYLGQDQGEEGELVENVNSSCIQQLRYRDGVITVVFFRGGHRIYTYPGDQRLFEAFANAPSVGGFFNTHFAP